MSEFDSTQVTAVIAVAAIISPILTAIINNIYQYLVKRLEIKEQQKQRANDYKRTVIENYLRTVGPYLTTNTQSLKEKYRETYALALLYVPQKTKDKMIAIDNAPFDYRFEAKEMLEKLIPELEQILCKL